MVRPLISAMKIIGRVCVNCSVSKNWRPVRVPFAGGCPGDVAERAWMSMSSRKKSGFEEERMTILCGACVCCFGEGGEEGVEIGC